MKKKVLILLVSVSLIMSGCTTAEVKLKDSSKDDTSSASEYDETDLSETDLDETTLIETKVTDTSLIDSSNGSEDMDADAEAMSSSTELSKQDEQTITLYTPNSNADGLDTQTVVLPDGDRTNIFSILAANNLVASDVSLNYVNVHTGDRGDVIEIDLSGAFITQLDSYSSAQVECTIASIINTYLEAYNANIMLITSDGNYLQGDHYDYTLHRYFMEINAEASNSLELHILDSFDDTFGIKTVYVDSITADQVIQSLSQAGSISSGVAVNEFDEFTDESLEKVLILDLNEEFLTSMKSYGSTGAQQVGCSLVNTFLNAFDADKIQISVNGVPPEGAHFNFNGYRYRY